MPVRGIVIGLKVRPEKVEAAHQLRRNMTIEEKLLWESLRAHRLRGLHFRRQQVIDGFVVDFYCHAASLVIEVDGPGHRSQANADRERDRIMEARGLRVLRFTNDAVRNHLDDVLSRILDEVKKP